ncbi:YjjG family noncanonical pyrimidine nucleotidase [Lactobacillaceae bacterium Melli_B3]
MYKYAMFDLDDTILDFQRGEVEGIRTILAKYGVDDVEQGRLVYSEINANVWRQIEAGGDKSTLLEQRFIDTFAHFGIDVYGAVVNTEYLSLIGDNFHLLPGAKPMLTRLHTAGVTLIAATNGIKRNQLKRLHGTGLDQLFDSAFISEDIGYAKPDRRFFDPIFDQYPGMNRQNVVMVGDGVSSDMVGAQNANLSSIWFNPKQNETPAKINPTYVANTFEDVESIILKDGQAK